jgi:hypothetical protein
MANARAEYVPFAPMSLNLPFEMAPHPALPSDGEREKPFWRGVMPLTGDYSGVWLTRPSPVGRLGWGVRCNETIASKDADQASSVWRWLAHAEDPVPGRGGSVLVPNPDARSLQRKASPT